MSSNLPIPPKILAILIIPVILLVGLVGALYFIPTPIPNKMDLTVQTIDGQTIHTTDFNGKILVVEFMATWCDYCKDIFQNIYGIFANTTQANNQIASDMQTVNTGNTSSFVNNTLDNVVFLSVSIDPTHDTNSVFTEFINKYNLEDYAFNNSQWIIGRDSKLQHYNYGVSNVPYSFLVGPNSQIISQHTGYMSYDFILSWIAKAATQYSI